MVSSLAGWPGCRIQNALSGMKGVPYRTPGVRRKAQGRFIADNDIAVLHGTPKIEGVPEFSHRYAAGFDFRDAAGADKYVCLDRTSGTVSRRSLRAFRRIRPRVISIDTPPSSFGTPIRAPSGMLLAISSVDR